ncbi:MAG: NAD(P)H-hydrate epimerase, partial [Bacteroidales bacterium]|nr:NAD(P)H-hydrate epimerase [Bacteroidales bacterium]
MKIPTIEQIRTCDANTIQYKHIPSIDLMERAAESCVDKITHMFPWGTQFSVFCGMGNNGGDGLAISRLLLNLGYQCQAFVMYYGDTYSDDCEKNLQRLQKKYPKNHKVKIITDKEEIPLLSDCQVIVDALFGSGLNKPIETPLLTQLIEKINSSSAFV